MALKDWKKVGKMEWRKKDFGLLIEQGFPGDVFPIIILSYNKDNSFDGVELRSFKTKSPALKFAKQYMETH